MMVWVRGGGVGDDGFEAHVGDGDAAVEDVQAYAAVDALAAEAGIGAAVEIGAEVVGELAGLEPRAGEREPREHAEHGAVGLVGGPLFVDVEDGDGRALGEERSARVDEVADAGGGVVFQLWQQRILCDWLWPADCGGCRERNVFWP